jgi:hypothetical protein
MHDDAADSLQSSVVPLRLPHRHLEGTVLRAASGTVRYSTVRMIYIIHTYDTSIHSHSEPEEVTALEM